MTEEAFYICSDCGSSVLAVSHTWMEHAEYEEVGHVQADGRCRFEDRVELGCKKESGSLIAAAAAKGSPSSGCRRAGCGYCKSLKSWRPNEGWRMGADQWRLANAG